MYMVICLNVRRRHRQFANADELTQFTYQGDNLTSAVFQDEAAAVEFAKELAQFHPLKLFTVLKVTKAFETTQPEVIEKEVDNLGQLTLARKTTKGGNVNLARFAQLMQMDLAAAPQPIDEDGEQALREVDLEEDDEPPEGGV